jgi:hypothetical protein
MSSPLFIDNHNFSNDDDFTDDDSDMMSVADDGENIICMLTYFFTLINRE